MSSSSSSDSSPQSGDDGPIQGPAYVYESSLGRWTPLTLPFAPPPEKVNTVSILTWNIDFVNKEEKARIDTAIAHIEQHFLDPNTLPVVLFQEIESGTSFERLRQSSFIREKYHLSTISGEDWNATYGTVTCVPKTMAIETVFRVEYTSNMGRDALFVDLQFGARKVRIANVHLESTRQGDDIRPVQLGIVNEYLREEGVETGIVCGDMNAIAEGDLSLASELKLVDIWEKVGVDVHNDQGVTWGHQPREIYAPGRLDKMLTTSMSSIVPLKMELFGVGLKTKRGTWVSDHYGLIANFGI